MGLIRMAYRAGDVKFSRRLLETELPAKDEVLYVGPAREDLVWDAARLEFRPPNAQEIAAQEAAEQAKATERQEADTARDDAKRALSALDTIIAGAPTATTAQLRAAVEQLARIQKHVILAAVGR